MSWRSNWHHFSRWTSGTEALHWRAKHAELESKLARIRHSFAHTLPSLLTLAEGKYDGTANEREGIVVRPETHTHSRILGGALSFKVISNKFLLSGGEDD